jgi:aryl-alcohol dehydrogenase-like predicted oxidoreductase
METRRLGRTDHLSSVAVLGGATFWNATPEQADAAVRMAVERGVNHIDIAPSYGAAEAVAGPTIGEFRDRLFIGEKTGRSNPDGVRAQLESSLVKLGCDSFDLYQAHGVTGVDVLDSRVNAIETMLEMRNEGLFRFVGITGHDLGAPRAHLEALRRWDLDTVMFPLYPRVYADPVYREDVIALLAECARGDVGVMVIKAAAKQPWGDRKPTHGTWYEPVTSPEAIRQGIRFALSHPGVHAFCSPGDLSLLPLVLDAADSFVPLSDAERDAAVAAAADDPIIFPLAEHARA